MRSWQKSNRKNFTAAAGKAFVAGASIPSVSQETLGNVHFVIQ
jgi:hypothetical protein